MTVQELIDHLGTFDPEFLVTAERVVGMGRGFLEKSDVHIGDRCDTIVIAPN